MDARTGYTDGMTQREPTGGVLVRAVAYVRVSSEEQRRHGYSLDDQERELRIQIGLKGWELVEVVRDEGLSGADPSRPGLRRIEELAREGKVDVALATKRNRWFRDIEHRRRYERGLRRMGARIAALNDSGNAIADGVDDLISEEQRRAEEHVEAERNRFEGAERDLAGREGRLRKLQERRSTLIDLAADGAITREDLRDKLSALDAECEGLKQELDALGRSEEEAVKLGELPALAESLARDLPYLLEKTPLVREYETIPEEKTEANPLGIYTLTPERIRHLSEEEVERRRRRAEDERAARYRAMYDDLGLSVVAYPDGTLEASWRFGAAVLRNGSDKSKNKHANRHFHATEHPLVQSFQPDDDWIWCYVDEVVMESAS